MGFFRSEIPSLKYTRPISFLSSRVEMLSAIAARKAALSAQALAPAEKTPSPASGSHTPSTTPRRNGTPKRKSSEQKSRPELKKVKVATKSNRRTVDEFKRQTDMIVVEDEDEDEDAGDDNDSDSGMSVLEYEKESLPQSGRIPTIKRAWSPSQPIDDSSDEDSPDQDSMPLDISSLFPGMSSSGKLPSEDNTPLSTFSPVVDQNIFVLNDSECNLLGLSEPTTLVGLTGDDSLCLLGTCILTVLQGSLSLFGTTISQSPKKHPIFAPRSSPLPILRSAPGPPSLSVLNASKASARLHPIHSFQTVIAIQENRTGAEGLGRICRTFEGVFEPSRWQSSSAQAPFKIPGVYMVCIIMIRYNFFYLTDIRSHNRPRTYMHSMYLRHGLTPSMPFRILMMTLYPEHISSRAPRTAERAHLRGRWSIGCWARASYIVVIYLRSNLPEVIAASRFLNAMSASQSSRLEAWLR
jgi:hypothetical protein